MFLPLRHYHHYCRFPQTPLNPLQPSYRMFLFLLAFIFYHLHSTHCAQPLCFYCAINRLKLSQHLSLFAVSLLYLTSHYSHALYLQSTFSLCHNFGASTLFHTKSHYCTQLLTHCPHFYLRLALFLQIVFLINFCVH